MELALAALQSDFLGTPIYFWLAFVAIVIGLLAFDLGVLHKDDHEIEAKESFILYSGYVAIALAFGGWVWWSHGAQSGLEFYTGYVIEQSLAMDNIFVIATIFTYFAVPRAYQHRVLFWGIIGAIVMRAIMIGFGAALVSQFSWILYIFGAFLVFTGLKMFKAGDEQGDISNNPVLGFLRKRFNITNELHGHDFTVRKVDPATGKSVLWLTPLAVALILVEFVDLIFAVDSVPAIFAVTLDPFIVYTSNIFAILGLRSLYFALAAAMHRFKYLKISLAVILVLVGIKIFLVPLGIKVDTLFSLIATLAILAAGIIFSLWKTKNEAIEQGAMTETSKKSALKSTEHAVENIILASRWLLVVFYLGLTAALGLYAISFVRKLWEYFSKVMVLEETDAILKILSLIDASLVASLVVMVIISGYENFVSRYDNVSETDAELSWLGKIDASSLKIKVASTIVAISSIHLLQVFLNADQYTDSKIMWLTVVHMAFVASALLLALIDKIMTATKQGKPHD